MTYDDWKTDVDENNDERCNCRSITHTGRHLSACAKNDEYGPEKYSDLDPEKYDAKDVNFVGSLIVQALTDAGRGHLLR